MMSESVEVNDDVSADARDLLQKVSFFAHDMESSTGPDRCIRCSRRSLRIARRLRRSSPILGFLMCTFHIPTSFDAPLLMAVPSDWKQLAQRRMAQPLRPRDDFRPVSSSLPSTDVPD